MKNLSVFLLLLYLIFPKHNLIAEEISTFSEACEPFGAVAYLSNLNPDEREILSEDRSRYGKIWQGVKDVIESSQAEKVRQIELNRCLRDSEIAYAYKLTETLKSHTEIKKNSVYQKIRDQIIDEYLIVALLWNNEEEFGLKASQTESLSLNQLLDAIPQKFRTGLAQENQACTVLTLANRAVNRLVQSQQYYTTLKGQRTVQGNIDFLSKQSERLLRGEGSYKLKTSSTPKEREILIKAHIYETMRYFSSLEFPDIVDRSYIAKLSLEIVGLQPGTFINLNNAYIQQKLAAALISAITLPVMAQYGENSFFGANNKNGYIYYGSYHINDVRFIIEDLCKLFPNLPGLENFLKEMGYTLEKEVLELFFRHFEDDNNLRQELKTFLRHHYAFNKTWGNEIRSELGYHKTFDSCQKAKLYIDNLLTHFPGGITKGILPYAAFVQEGMFYLSDRGLMTRAKAQELSERIVIDYEVSEKEEITDLASLLSWPTSHDDWPLIARMKEYYKQVEEIKFEEPNVDVTEYDQFVQDFSELYNSLAGNGEEKLRESFNNIHSFLRTFSFSNPSTIGKPLVLRAALSWVNILTSENKAAKRIGLKYFGLISENWFNFLEDNNKYYLPFQDKITEDYIVAAKTEMASKSLKKFSAFTPGSIKKVEKKTVEDMLTIYKVSKKKGNIYIEGGFFRHLINNFRRGEGEKPVITSDIVAQELLLILSMDNPVEAVNHYLAV